MYILTASLCALVLIYGLLKILWSDNSGEKPRTERWRSVFLIAALAACGWGLAVSLTEIIAFHDFREPAYLGEEEPGSLRCDYAIVIGRRPERSTTTEVSMPYRNSPLALYHREDSGRWVKIQGDLLCRSTTTTSAPPMPTDRDAVSSFSADRGVHYRWGHMSVPFGRYSLSPTPWRTGDTAFLISELYSSDGTIALITPQILTASRLATPEGSDEPNVINDPDVVPIITYVKQYCYIHPSFTRDWSHRDSLGCINLYHGQEEGQEGQLTDWATFFSWIEGRGLLDKPLALVVASFEELAGPGATALPDTLSLDEL